MLYKDDREWTDKAHELAVKEIYRKVGWWCIDDIWHKEHLNEEDQKAGIDHIGLCKEEDSWFMDVGYRKNVYIQERFRKADKNSFNDFTLRYKRDNSKSDNQKDSEYYKLEKVLCDPSNERDYRMCYGTLNEKEDGFLKFAILDLNKLYEHIEKGDIVVGENDSYFSKVVGNKMFAGYGENKDGSSSFVSFDIRLLGKVFDDVVLYQEGFKGLENSKFEEKALSHVIDIENKGIDILSYYSNDDKDIWTYFVDIYDASRDRNIIAKLKVNEQTRKFGIEIPDAVKDETYKADVQYIKEHGKEIIPYCQKKRFDIYNTIDEMEKILNEISYNNKVYLTKDKILENEMKIEMGTHYIIEDYGSIITELSDGTDTWKAFDSDGIFIESGNDFDKNLSDIINAKDYELEIW